MRKTPITVQDRDGNAVTGAEVYVREDATPPEDGALASIYSDNGITGITNPTTTDANGFAEFFVTDGVYTIQIFVDGEEQRTISKLQIFDDLDNEINAIRLTTSAVDKGPYFTGSGTAQVYTLTAPWRTFGALTDPNADRIPFWDDSAGAGAWLTLGSGLTIVGDTISSTSSGGLSWLEAARVATTVAGTLASSFENGDTIDGVVLATNDRILIKNQAAPAENGIYTVNASGAPTRATDADAGAELVSAALFISEGTANHDTQWTCTSDDPISLGSTAITWVQVASGAGLLQAVNNLSDVSNTSTAISNLSGIAQGTHTIPVLAGSMTSRTTNGAASGTAESTTNKVMTRTLDFDASTNEFVQITIPMPKSWDEGTVTVQFLWTADSGSGDVVWGCHAVALSNDDALDTAFGTAQTVTDTLLTALDVHTTSYTSAITIAGTPAAEDMVVFQFYRDAGSVSDTLAVDAKLICVRIHYTINATNDA